MRAITIMCLAGCFLATSTPVNGFQGELLAQFDYEVSRFLMHPDRPIMYASARSTNSVLVIDTITLEVIAEPFVGSNPGGMAISNDGQRLFVANTSSNFVGVVDTETNALIDIIGVAELARDVEVGWDDRLYVMGDNSLMQLDPNTGDSVGPNIGNLNMVYNGEIAISPDKERLYYADYGLSPASLYQFDVTGDTAILLWESPHGGTSGSNGQDLAISHDGSFVSYACGYGQGGYLIAKYRTSDMLTEGTFDCGAYPREITFSPDDAFAYSVHTSGGIDVWDTTTFLLENTIFVSGEANELQVDSSRRYLFAAFDSELRIYSTGRGVVPPASMIVEVGTLQSGDVTSTFASDDIDLVVKRANVFPPKIQVVFDGTLSSDNPSQLSVQLESRVTAFFFNRTHERIAMYNWNTDSFEQVSTDRASNTDRITVVDLTTDIAKYVQPGTGNVRTRLTWFARAQPTFDWDAEIDQLVWIEE